MKFKSLFLLLLLLSGSITSQVVINEFCVANYSHWDQGGDNEDWLELYNTSTSSVNIGGFWLSNDISNPMKWQIPQGTTLAAGQYLVILLSGTGEYDPNQFGFLNTSFRVTQTDGEDLVFSNASGTILESWDMEVLGSFQANHSYGRIENSSSNFGIFTTPTQNAQNIGDYYNSYSTKPIISEQAGYKSGPINVTITSDANTTIYYTLDGSEPNNTSLTYTGPILINSTTSLRAISYSNNIGILPSYIETNTYFFGSDIHQVMIVNISGGTLSDGSWSGNELTHIEFFTPNGTFISEATGDSNEHGNDSNAYPQRGFDYITRDALGYDNEIEFPVFFSSNRQGYERLIFKAAANDNYPNSGGAHIRDSYVHRLSEVGNLHLDERKVESCVVYINGVYWGVYDTREKVDDIDYTKFYYNQPDGFVDFLKTWGGTWNEYGTGDDWYDLVNFITTNDMSDPVNYEYVLTQYNHMSLIDYFILNGYIVSTDWLNWNTSWWRGRNPQGDGKRWRYALWDNDASFGHYVNYTGVPSNQPTADPCQIDGMGDVGGQGHVPVLNALFNNEDFFADYIQRYATLSNTTFSCTRMIEVLDSMIMVIEPEMQRHCSRWGGTYEGWQLSVQQLRDYILERCNTEIITGIEDCYDVTAYTITIQIDGLGEIEVESLNLTSNTTPYVGTYFAQLPIDLFANSDGELCGNFSEWEISSGIGTIADSQSDSTTISISSDVTLIAHFTEPSGDPISITVDTDLVNAGLVVVDGEGYSQLPTTNQFNPGEEIQISVSENEWFIFDHWESTTTEINPSSNDIDITITPCRTDTLVAVFDYIEHYEINIQTNVEEGGFILLNGDTISSEGVTLDLESSIIYSLTAVQSNQWSQFAYWEIDGNSISPDMFSSTILLTLFEDGSITAVFNITPNHEVTVIVEPSESGTVIFEENYLSKNVYSTTSSTTVVLEGNKPLLFRAVPNSFIDFNNWSSNNNQVIGSTEDVQVKYSLTNRDTIVAYFTQQPFTLFVPNGFSPNGDGINDVFKVIGNAIDFEEYEFNIFDRWGQVIFSSTSPEDVWTGEFNNGEYYVVNSQYQYLLKVKSVFEYNKREYSGSILLFR